MNEPQASPTPGIVERLREWEARKWPKRSLDDDIGEAAHTIERLQAQRDRLVRALEDCLTDIEALMHDTYGDTVILPLSHDRGRAALAEVGKGES